MKNILIVFSIIFICLIQGCFQVSAPPKIVSGNLPNHKLSTINIPVTIKSSDVRNEVVKVLENKEFHWKSGRLGANLLLSESKEIPTVVRVLVTPFKPGYWKRVPRKKKKKIKKWCGFFPVICGSNWVTYTVYEKVWVPATQAVYKNVVRPVVKVFDKLYKVGAWVSADYRLTGVDIKFKGNKAIIKATTDIDLSVDYQRNIVPLGPKLKIRGVKAGKLKAEFKVVSDIDVLSDGKLVIKSNGSVENLDYHSKFLPTAFAGINYLNLIGPHTKMISKKINKEVVDLINKEALKDSYITRLDLKPQLLKAASKISEPRKLAEEVWLINHVNRISLGSFNGKGEGLNNSLVVNVGLETESKIVYGAMPNQKQNKQPEIGVNTIKSDQFNLSPRIQLSYTSVANLLKYELSKIVSKKKIGSIRPDVSKVELYPSKDKLIFAVEIIDKSDFSKLGVFYLSGKLTTNFREKIISLKDVRFTSDTRTSMGRFVALLDPIIESKIQAVSKFSYRKQFNKLKKRLTNYQANLDGGVLRVSMNKIGVKNILLGENHILVDLNMQGDANYELLSVGNSVRSANNLTYSAADENESLSELVVKFGDDLFDEDGNKLVADISNITLPGEVVYVRNELQEEFVYENTGENRYEDHRKIWLNKMFYHVDIYEVDTSTENEKLVFSHSRFDSNDVDNALADNLSIAPRELLQCEDDSVSYKLILSMMNGEDYIAYSSNKACDEDLTFDYIDIDNLFKLTN